MNESEKILLQKESEAEARLIVVAERALERKLSAEELAVVKGYGFVAEDLAYRFHAEPQWNVEEFFGGGYREANKFDRLINPTVPVAEAWNRFVAEQKPTTRELLQEIHFEAEIAAFSEWLLIFARGNFVRPLLYFSLGEIGESVGCECCLVGGDDLRHLYPAIPNGGLCRAPVEPQAEIWKRLDEVDSGEPWQVMLAITLIEVRAFFERHGREFREAARLDYVSVYVGWPEGDLYRVRMTYE